MILPGTLHPALVRKGIVGEVKHLAARSSPDDYLVASDGIWLPPLYLAKLEIETAEQEIPRFAADIGRISLGSDGCWLSEEGILDPNDKVAQVAQLETGNPVINPVPDIDNLRLCDHTSCVYGRHYDLTFGSRGKCRTLASPDSRFYEHQKNGDITTIWGNILPSLGTSALKLNDLQMQCPPYSSEKTSPLTAHNIGQITLSEVSGCWEVRSYYMRSKKYINQTNGYAYITRRAHLAPDDVAKKSNQMLAHRVIWQVTGNKLKEDRALNHLCGYRACANPLHIRQVTWSANQKHSQRMQRAIRALGLAA